jgi:hypothetical protein
VPEDIKLPSYDLIYPSYKGMAYFEVFSLENRRDFGIFVGVGASKRSFEFVKYVIWHEKAGNEREATTLTTPFENCGFRLSSFGNDEASLEAVTLCD